MPSLIRRWAIFTILAITSLFLLLKLVERNSLQTSLFPLEPSRNRPPAFDISSLPDFRWRDLPQQYPVEPENFVPLPVGAPEEIPQIQYDFTTSKETPEQRKERQTRMQAVKEAFTHSWNGYKENAWLHDEVKPLSGNPADPFGGWGATLVDTLDTLWIMGLQQEFAEAVEAVAQIDFSTAAVKEINVFETTIRYLGGFLSAYDLSEGQYPLLLQKAEEVAELLYRCFDTPNRMPITRWDWRKYLRNDPQKAPKLEVVAEIGSLTLEFTRLSQITGDPRWYDAVQRIMIIFEREQSKTLIPGLWPLTVNPLTENMHEDNRFTIGGMADSVFEYLSKEYILLGGRSHEYASMHNSMVRATKSYLAFEPLLPPSTISEFNASPLFLGTLNINTRRNGQRTLDPQGEHLTCFAGGMLALGARALSDSLSSAKYAEDMAVARRLTDGCIWSYFTAPLGIGPEIFFTLPCRQGRDAITSGAEPDSEGNNGDCTWDRERWLNNLKKVPKNIGTALEAREAYAKDRGLEGGFTSVSDPKYILRPEAIESLFILYRTTGDPKLRDHAWRMFSAIAKYARTSVAFAALPDIMHPAAEGGDVHNGGVRQTDGMESFWTAETLKYFYLMFEEEDVVSLDEFVFNTEAHPFRWRYGMGRTRARGKAG